MQEIAKAWLPTIMGDEDVLVRSAGAAFLAGVATLNAEAGVSIDCFKPAADKLAATIGEKGKLPTYEALITLRAVRLFGAAAAKAGVGVSAGVASIAAAVAIRGVDKAGEVSNQSERTMAALLGGRNEAELKSSLERLVKGVDDKAAAKALHDYASKRYPFMTKCAAEDVENGFTWDV